MTAYIDKSLQILIQTRQIILSLLILRDQGLLAFEKLLPSLFELFPFCMLVIDPCDHQFMLVRTLVFWMQGDELFDRDQR